MDFIVVVLSRLDFHQSILGFKATGYQGGRSEQNLKNVIALLLINFIMRRGRHVELQILRSVMRYSLVPHPTMP